MNNFEIFNVFASWKWKEWGKDRGLKFQFHYKTNEIVRIHTPEINMQ